MARSIEELSVEELIQIVRLITARAHLLNKVEQLQIIRINRERAKDATKESPRNESVRSAILKIEQRGRSKAEIQKSLGKLRIEPTLTAHPTEARRRTILDKQLEVASTLVKLRQKDLTPDEAEGLQRHLVNRIELLLATDDVRVRRLEVPEEVQNGLYFLTTTICARFQNWLKTWPRVSVWMQPKSLPSCSTARGSEATGMGTRMSPTKLQKAPLKPSMPPQESCGTLNSKNFTENSALPHAGPISL